MTTTTTSHEDRIVSLLQNILLDGRGSTPQSLKGDALDLYAVARVRQIRREFQAKRREKSLTRTVTWRNPQGGSDLTTNLPVSRYEEIQKEWKTDGRKIQAIKLLRETTGWGLREAKEACEDSRNFEQPPTQPPHSAYRY
jgi:ribosomal protein L7/L12